MARYSDTASESSSSSAPFSWPTLPVTPLRSKIVQKIRENRVTLIIGDTGCGKSSQVPLFLLEENFEPILCTQPRRFAVVAIAKMVAKSRNCEVGSEIGYHIGHSNVSDITSTRSRIVFKTAGVLLEQMRDKGSTALNYKVIILDEVHERSVESDLVLACVKQFMLRNNDLRVVLMSATADLSRYRDYFKDLGRGERVEIIAIPSASQHSIFQRKVLYLEQIAELLGESSESPLPSYGLNHSSADAKMKPEVHALIHKLVLHIHENEPERHKSILVFLPTYYSLEKQWILLKPFASIFKVHILHSSIDIGEALLAMKSCNSHRKVILATDIAESSVTIPGVAHVIDSCRSLQVFWDSNRKTDSAELVWVSKSQAEQRKGRTGRTCDGQIYRLVTRMFYNNLLLHEYPSILRLSLRKEVLMICCAGSKAINDPKVLLPKLMDPPDSEVVEHALSLLVHIRALEKPRSHRAQYEPTFYGRLMDSLPLSFNSSMLALKFGEIGLLREGILTSIIMDSQPLPILQPFGNPTLFVKYINSYFDDTDNILEGKKETVSVANLCAFQFWQHVFKDKHRLEHLKQILKVDESQSSQVPISQLEEEWCFFHNLFQTSLYNVSKIYEDVISIMHRFRPSFFATNELTSFLKPHGFKHTCLVQSELAADTNVLTQDDESLDSLSERGKCLALPFVGPNDFQARNVSQKLKTLIKEIKAQCIEDTSWKQGEIVNDIVPRASDVASCRYFMKGLCKNGNQCSFSHSLQAKRPVCKFFLTLQGCRNGDSCLFSHDYGHNNLSLSGPGVLQEEGIAAAYDFLQLLPTTAYSRVLILNDKKLHFSSSLSQRYDTSKLIVTTSDPYSSDDFDISLDGGTILWNIVRPCDPIIETKWDLIPWREVKCVLLFVDVEVDDLKIQHHLVQNFFEYLAIRVMAEKLYDLQVTITMNNIRFAKLQVEKLARDCFFFLRNSFLFDESSLGMFSFSSTITRPMQVSAPFSYVFDMVAPKGIEFGDYSAEFKKALYSYQ